MGVCVLNARQRPVTLATYDNQFPTPGLQRLYERGERRHIPPEVVDKVERVLSRLDVATEPQDMNLPGYRLHRLRGNRAGFWSVSISGTGG